MKIIHCADIHLDSAMTTHLDSSQAVQRRNELLITFIKMNEYAAKKQVEMILIAGDLFDTQFVTDHTKQQVLASINQNRHIQYVYIEGNHDEGGVFRELNNRPDNFHFLSVGERYDYKQITVLAEDKPERIQLSPERINILMLHGEPDLKPYAGRNIDYMALGHLHRYSKQMIDYRGIACYSGCLEGRGFDETGEKGFIMIDTGTQQGRLFHQFVAFSSRIVAECSVNIEGAESTSEICKRIDTILCQCGVRSQDMVRVCLMGYISPKMRVSKSYIEQIYQIKFFLFQLDMKQLRVYTDVSAYKCDSTLKGAFVRKVYASMESEDIKRQILELGIAVLSGEEPG